MSVFFIGDPHLGHRSIAKYRPFVKSSDDNTKLFLDLYDKTVRKKDIVYFLGDVAFDVDHLMLIKPLRGRKILIKGNHDDYVPTSAHHDVFDDIHGMISYKNFWLSHCPIHVDEIRGRVGNVHGHVHAKSIHKRTWYGKRVLDKRYFNACVDVIYPQTKNMLVPLDSIKHYFNIQ